MKITAHKLRVFSAFAADVSNSFGSLWEAVFSLNQLAEKVLQGSVPCEQRKWGLLLTRLPIKGF